MASTVQRKSIEVLLQNNVHLVSPVSCSTSVDGWIFVIAQVRGPDFPRYNDPQIGVWVTNLSKAYLVNPNAEFACGGEMSWKEAYEDIPGLRDTDELYDAIGYVLAH